MSGIEFSRQLLRLALAQLLKDAGFDGAGAISLGVLVDVAERYLELVGQRSAELARAAGRTDVSLFDAETALSSLSVSREVLVGYFFEFGLRIPAAARAQQILQQQEEQQQKQRAALLGSGSGNAILDAILGLKKDAGVGESKESQQAAPIEEISGFFRMEPGPFPLGNHDIFIGKRFYGLT